MTFLKVTMGETRNRELKRALRSLNRYIDSNYVSGTFFEATFTAKQIQLLERGADWMTPLGGVKSKCYMFYTCTLCDPNQGAVSSSGWFLTSSAVVADPWTGILSKLVNPKWKCPFCGGKYKCVNGARGLVIDDREHEEDEGEVVILPLTWNLHQQEPNHPDHELEKQVEALIDFLRYVSLADQVGIDVDAKVIRNAIDQTNFMVQNRLQATRSVKFKRTKNIVTENVDYPTTGAKIVCLAPELSLSVIGTEIPVIEMPVGIPYPTLEELAFIVTTIGSMVMHRPLPAHTIDDVGKNAEEIERAYTKGRKSLDFMHRRSSSGPA